MYVNLESFLISRIERVLPCFGHHCTKQLDRHLFCFLYVVCCCLRFLFCFGVFTTPPAIILAVAAKAYNYVCSNSHGLINTHGYMQTHTPTNKHAYVCMCVCINIYVMCFVVVVIPVFIVATLHTHFVNKTRFVVVSPSYLMRIS